MSRFAARLVFVPQQTEILYAEKRIGIEYMARHLGRTPFSKSWKREYGT